MPTIATPEAYLPGFAPPDIEVNPPGTAADTPRPDWWVKRSAKQTVDVAGQPVGFKHTLMYGSKIIRSGTGANPGRAFMRQAEFLNSKSAEPTPTTRRA